MKVDPNIAPVNMQVEHVMCQVGGVELHDGTVVKPAQLTAQGGEFEAFCKELDPNTGYIAAFVPDRQADQIFYEARQAASSYGIHMQATIEKAERQLESWRAYKQLKARKATA